MDFLFIREKHQPIRERCALYYNIELYELAKKKGFMIPEYHFPVVIDLVLLRNDFEKFHIYRLWCPLESNLNKTWRAFQIIFEPVIMGSVFLTFEQAVQRAEKSTSPGFYYKSLGCTTREMVFTNYKDDLKAKVDAVFSGQMEETIWETAPKVEIRSLEKLIHPDEEKRKQRTFMCCDTLCYIVALMLYGDQNDKMLEMATTKHWSAVGISIFHGGWNHLANQILQGTSARREGNARFYDVSAMEASIKVNLFELIYSFRNSSLHGNANAKEWFLLNKIYSKVKDPDGFMGFKTGSNPSGCLNTLSDNTWALIFVFMYNLSFYAQDVNALIDLYWDKPVKIMGDDSIVADDVVWDSLLAHSKDLGFTIKYEAGDELNPALPITEGKFLNFGFVYDMPHNMWIFKPNFDKLLAGLFFYRKSNSWRLTMAKLYALRVLCYNFPSRLQEIESYIALIWNKYNHQMKIEHQMDEKIPYIQLRSLHLPSEEIEFLLFGNEKGQARAFEEFYGCSIKSFGSIFEP